VATRKTTRTRKPAPRKSTATAPARERYSGAHVWTGAAVIVLGLILLAYILFGLLLNFTGWSGGATRAITGILFYPAATVIVPGYLGYYLLSMAMLAILGGSGAYLIYLAVTKNVGRNRRTIITGFLFLAGIASLFSVPRLSDGVVGYHEYLERVSAFTKLEAAQKQQATAQGAADQVQTTPESTKQARALSQLITNNVVRQEATKFNVEISKKDVNDLYKQYVDQAGGESQLKSRISDVLGWSPGTFKRELRVQLMQQKLAEKLQTDDKLNEDQKKKADDFLKQVKDGKDFAEVAKQSDDPTAAAGGDQGFVKKGELDPALEGVVFSLQPGQVSDVVKTSSGYVIVKAEEVKSADEVRIRQILVRTTSLTTFIPDQLKNTKISIYVKDLYWDANLFAVQPKDQQNAQPAASDSPAPAPATAAPAAQ
jgi:parvulin-like peptidyl-prolyl isomerase